MDARPAIDERAELSPALAIFYTWFIGRCPGAGEADLENAARLTVVLVPAGFFVAYRKRA